MSAVARIMVARGVPVSGTDVKDLPVMRDLSLAGARIAVGYDAGNLGNAQTVVAGSAIRADNPELVAAREAGLPVLHRSEALAATMAGHRVVTVAGTHGKSTTTSMVTVLLQEAGLDPSFAIGANVPALGVNAAHGRSDIFVAEADESDGSFLNYRPLIAVVTNVEADHLGPLRDRRKPSSLPLIVHRAAACPWRAAGLCRRRRSPGPGRAHPASTGTTRVSTLRHFPDDADVQLHDGGPGDVRLSPAAVSPLELQVPGTAQRAERRRRLRRRPRTRGGTRRRGSGAGATSPARPAASNSRARPGRAGL